MQYHLQFGQVAADIPYVLRGAWTTLWITVATFAAGSALGLGCALAKVNRCPGARALAGAWVARFTNAPLFVVIWFLFNGLPEAGILLSPAGATLIGFTAVSSGYLAEIQRGGILSVRRAELDAAEALGMSLVQTVRYVVVPHVMKTVYAPMANFFIFLMLGTSMSALVGVDEMTGRALEVYSRSFRSIEIFLVLAAAYVVLSLLASLALALVGRLVFRVRAKVF